MPRKGVLTRVCDIAPAGEGIKRITLADPDGYDLPPFRPGAHIDLYLPNDLVRSYSLCNDPAERNRYVLGVKREPNGRGGSAFLHDRLQAGDELYVSLPRGGIDLGTAATRHVFIAGGIGVTPFLSALAALKRLGRDNGRLHMFARGTPPLSDLLIAHGDAVVAYDTMTTLRPAIADLVGPAHPDLRVSCCGPESMVAAFEAATATWPEAQVHVERFVPLALPPDPQARPYVLVLARSQQSVEIEAGGSALEGLRRLGAKVDASCEGGVCGACRTRWLEGPPVHRDRFLTPAERERDVLVCVAGCAGPRLVLDL